MGVVFIINNSMTKEDTCEKVDSKKYKTRKSPPYHAGKCKGKVLKGNDRNRWKSVADSRGVYTWKPVNETRKQTALPKGKAYETHDNYGRPFFVIDSGKKIDVFRQIYNENSKNYEVTKKVFSTSYVKLFVGKNPLNKPGYPNKSYTGNSLLAQVNKHTYIFIGHEICEFTTKENDSIVQFVSPVGNNDVPYPYAIGETHTYFFLENKVVPNSVLDFKRDVYGQLYGHIENKNVEEAAKSMKKKVLVKRKL